MSDTPSDSVVSSAVSNAGVIGLIPGGGTEIPQAGQRGYRKIKKFFKNVTLKKKKPNKTKLVKE